MEPLRDLREQEKLRETKVVLSVITHKMVTPLFMLFWICDLIYIPEKKWEFLFVRGLVAPISLLTKFYLRKIKNFSHAQNLAFFYIGSLAFTINYMIFRIGDWESPYYAGLSLVAMGSLGLIPWSWKFFSFSVMVIYAPYFFGAFFIPTEHTQGLNFVFIHSFFIFGTVVITVFLRFLTEQLRHKGLESRQRLREEIIFRGRIIEEKTQEALKLSELSRQFSPQVVEAIRNNQVQLSDEVHRSNICVIFVDIVNSTERVTRIDKDAVTRVIDRFMQDSARTLLKYDITIDKFLGDGLLAFSNDPVTYNDYIERVLRAAIEIREKLIKDQKFYEQNWLGPLQIRTGIAVGIANVGFYGNQKYYHSYTAIGPVINLANRLCSTAQPGQILVSNEVFKALDNHSEFGFKFIGTKILKGFSGGEVSVFEALTAPKMNLVNMDEVDCPSCNHVMHIETNSEGFFIFKCRRCGYILDQYIKSSA